MFSKIFKNMPHPLLILALVLSCIGSATAVMGGDSAETESANVPGQRRCTMILGDEDQLISFLNQQKNDRTNPECIERAIVQLGSLRTPKAAPILTELLDFPMPLTADEESERMLIASSHNGSRYKAIEALFEIGPSALPSVIKVIRENRFASPIRLKNALEAYFDIHREDIVHARKDLKAVTMGDLCPSLQNADNKALISFLENNKGKVNHDNSECIAFAISELGKEKETTAIKALLGYLDYEWPAEAGAIEVNPDHPLFYQQQRYPAVTALFLMGSPALMPLVHQLENESLTEKARAKALETIMLYYAEYPPTGIKVIRLSLDKVAKASSERLKGAALEWCDVEHRSLCESALRAN